jgi:YidC/Oxa1 family membrane protein insertase
MTEGPNKLLRVLVPVVLLVVVGGFIALAVFRSSTTPVGTPQAGAPSAGSQAATTPGPKPEGPAATTTPLATAAPAAAQPEMPVAGAPPAQVAPTPMPTAGPNSPGPTTPASALSVRAVPLTELSPLGSRQPVSEGGTFEMELRFSEVGAGLESLALANHFTTIKRTEPDTLQQRSILQAPTPDGSPQRVGLVSFAADAVEIDGARLSLWLAGPKQSFWRQTSPGVFEALIVDAADVPQLRVTREYALEPGKFEFAIRQRVENLSGGARSVRFIQYGPKDLPLPMIRYGGEVRRVRFGYMLPAMSDPSQLVLSGDSRSTFIAHADALDKPASTSALGVSTWNPKSIWPTPEAADNKYQLAWAATSNRYFTVAVHAMPPVNFTPTAGGKLGSPRPAFTGVETIDRLAIAAPANQQSSGPEGIVALRLSSPVVKLEPSTSADFSVSVYAGPTSKKFIQAQPRAFWAELQSIVIFTFGGPCGFCTFQPIAILLRWLLGILHDYVLFDWALGIMFLVVVVRTILHPVTRWSQVNMLRFSKRMGKMAPAMKALQEKYKDDKVKLQQEQARIMQEHGASFGVGALGCIPALLQTPVWIALYAMLFFTFELRHEGAFYSVFQNLTGNRWSFLGDLAEPDLFISFGTSFWIPFISGLFGPIEGLNILPLALGVVFFIQQKYMSPPPTTPLSEEQQMQQNIAKWMMVIMFPLFMYNAASGLALYFLTNSTLSILETKAIRRKYEPIVEAEEVARDARKKRREADPAPQEGFLARLQRLAMEQQKAREQQAKAKARQVKKGK